MKYSFTKFLTETALILPEKLKIAINEGCEEIEFSSKIDKQDISKLKSLFENYSEFSKLYNLGVSESLSNLKNLELYQTNINFSYGIDNLLEKITMCKEYEIIKDIFEFLKDYCWDKNVNSEYEIIKSVFDKFRSHILVINAINSLKEQDEELNLPLIRKLERSFNLPSSHVKNYIHSSFHRLEYRHPIIQDLMDKLQLVSSRSQNSFTGYTSKDGRTKLTQEMMPYHKANASNQYVMVGKNVYKVGKKLSLISESKEVYKKLSQAKAILLNSHVFNNEFEISGKKFKTSESGLAYQGNLNECLNDSLIQGIMELKDYFAIPQFTCQLNIDGVGTFHFLIADEETNVTQQIGNTPAEMEEFSTTVPLTESLLRRFCRLSGEPQLFLESLKSVGKIRLYEADPEDPKPEDDLNLDLGDAGAGADEFNFDLNLEDMMSPETDPLAPEEEIDPEVQSKIDDLKAKTEKIEGDINNIKNLDASYQEDKEVKDLYLKLLGKKSLLETELDEIINSLPKKQVDLDNSIVNEAKNANNTFTLKEIQKEWDEMYGENFKEKYSGLNTLLKNLGDKITLKDITQLWDKTYGENFKEEYSGLYKKLKMEKIKVNEDLNKKFGDAIQKEVKKFIELAINNFLLSKSNSEITNEIVTIITNSTLSEKDKTELVAELKVFAENPKDEATYDKINKIVTTLAPVKVESKNEGLGTGFTEWLESFVKTAENGDAITLEDVPTEFEDKGEELDDTFQKFLNDGKLEKDGEGFKVVKKVNETLTAEEQALEDEYNELTASPESQKANAIRIKELEQLLADKGMMNEDHSGENFSLTTTLSDDDWKRVVDEINSGKLTVKPSKNPAEPIMCIFRGDKEVGMYDTSSMELKSNETLEELLSGKKTVNEITTEGGSSFEDIYGNDVLFKNESKLEILEVTNEHILVNNGEEKMKFSPASKLFEGLIPIVKISINEAKVLELKDNHTYKVKNNFMYENIAVQRHSLLTYNEDYKFFLMENSQPVEVADINNIEEYSAFSIDSLKPGKLYKHCDSDKIFAYKGIAGAGVLAHTYLFTNSSEEPLVLTEEEVERCIAPEDTEA